MGAWKTLTPEAADMLDRAESQPNPSMLADLTAPRTALSRTVYFVLTMLLKVPALLMFKGCDRGHVATRHHSRANRHQVRDHGGGHLEHDAGTGCSPRSTHNFFSEVPRTTWSSGPRSWSTCRTPENRVQLLQRARPKGGGRRRNQGPRKADERQWHGLGFKGPDPRCEGRGAPENQECVTRRAAEQLLVCTRATWKRKQKQRQRQGQRHRQDQEKRARKGKECRYGTRDGSNGSEFGREEGRMSTDFLNRQVTLQISLPVR